MAKNKKKQSQYQHNKVTEAQRRNLFFYKLNYLITTVTGDPSVFKLIPENECAFMFLLHYNAPRVKAAPGSVINPRLLELIRQLILRKLKSQTITYTPKGPAITIDMFLTVGMTLFVYLEILADNKFPAAKELKKRLAAVSVSTDEDDNTDIMGTLRSIMSDPIEAIPTLLNNFEDIIYWITLESVSDETSLIPVPYYQFTIHTYKPKKMHVVVEGITRPAYEVCWGDRYDGFIKIEITPEQLELPVNEYPEAMPVYIQTHALNRLYERVDCIDASLLTLCMYYSFAYFSFSRGTHNTYLVNYKMSGKKLGYLVASVQQGVLLVHTFLLTTNNGTPEGNKLALLTKLNKLDKEYLAIDKLSTFYASDITDNPEVKKLFMDAGCSDLFNLNPKLLLKGTIEQKKPLAEKILAYLNLTTADENLETYRKEQMPV